MNTNKRYFVENSYFFDSHKYDIELIKKVLKDFTSVKNVRTAYNYGWNNQPKIVSFSIDIFIDCNFNQITLEMYISKIKSALEKAFNCQGLQSIYISEKEF